MLRQHWNTLIAVVGGNLLYFALQPHLPPAARHKLYQFDLGLVVDFWLCLAVYGLLALFSKKKPK